MEKLLSVGIGTTNERDELLDTKAAAEYLGVKAHTLDAWRSSGRYGLKFVRVGRLIKYKRRAHLEAFIDARTVGADAA